MRCTGFLRRCCSEPLLLGPKPKSLRHAYKWSHNFLYSFPIVPHVYKAQREFPPSHRVSRGRIEGGAASYEHTAVLLKNRLYRRWGIKSAREFARIKIEGLRLVGGHPDFTNTPAHADDGARFYDRQQAYVPARGG